MRVVPGSLETLTPGFQWKRVVLLVLLSTISAACEEGGGGAEGPDVCEIIDCNTPIFTPPINFPPIGPPTPPAPPPPPPQLPQMEKMTTMRPPAQNSGVCDVDGVSSGNEPDDCEKSQGSPSADAPRDTPAGSDGGSGGGCDSGDPCGPASNRAGAGLISLFNGQEVRDEVDLFIPGRDGDVDLSIRRRHLSRLPQPFSIFGFAWAFNYAHGFVEQPDGSLVVMGFGRTDRYEKVAPNVWEGSTGRYGRLTYDGVSTSVLWMPGGTSLELHTEAMPNGKLFANLQALVSSNGNRIAFEYESASLVPGLLERRLLRMRDSFGRDITFHYEDPDFPAGVSRIREVFSGRQVLYDYNAIGQLMTVTRPTVTSTAGLNDFPSGKTTRYSYADTVVDPLAVAQQFFGITAQQLQTRLSGPNPDPAAAECVARVRIAFQNSLSSVVYPNNQSSGQTRLQWTYYTDFRRFDFARVATHTIGNSAGPNAAGGSYAYSYTMTPGGNGSPNQAVFSTTATDRRGTQTIAAFNMLGQMLSERVLTSGLRPNQPSEYLRTFQYNADGDLVSAVDPMGATTTYGITDGTNVPRRSRGNTTTTTWTPDPVRASVSNQTSIRQDVVYEPIFNRVFKRVDPRGFETGDAVSFTTTYVFDYMENLATAKAIFAPRMGISESALQALFDAAGITSTGDVNGDGVTSQRSGNVVKIIHPPVTLPAEASRMSLAVAQNATELWTYNAFGQKIRHVDGEGNVTRWAYNSERDPDGDAVVDNPSGNNLTGGYLKETIFDAEATAGRNSNQNPPIVSQTVLYRYGPQGGGVFPKNPRGVPTAIFDPRGIMHTYLVNELDQVVRYVRAADVSSTTEQGLTAFAYQSITLYDANDNVVETRIQNKDGLDGQNDFIVNQFTYDILDQRIAEVWDVGGIEIRNEFQYDPSQNRTAELWARFTPEQSVDTYSYDERDIPIAKARGLFAPEESVTTTEIDLNGNLTAWIDSDGDRMQIRRDGYNRRKEVTDRVGNMTAYEYDAASNVFRRTQFGPPEPGSPSTGLAQVSWLFDTRNRAFREDWTLVQNAPITPLDTGALQARSPSFSGACLFFANSCVSKIFIHDRLNRVVGVVDGDDDTYESRYDGLSRLVSYRDPLDNRVDWIYDLNDNPTRVTETERASSPSLFTAAESFVTNRAYDALNRLIREVEPNGQLTKFTYDSRDNLIRRTDALTNQIESRPDRLDRVLSQRRYLSTLTPGQTATGSSAATADAMQGGGDGRIEVQFEYDDLHRTKFRTDDNGKRTEYVYDPLHRLRQIRYPDGTQETWTFNGDDEPLTHTNSNGSIETWTHDEAGRPTEVTINNSASPSTLGTTVRRWGYDGLDRVVTTFDNNGAEADVSIRYFYDSLSRRVRETQSIVGFPALSTDEFWRAENQRYRTIYPNARQVNSLHDVLDRESRIEEGGVAIATYDYVGPWRDLRIILGNNSRLDLRNSAGTGSISGTNPGYDTNRRNVRRNWATSGGGLIARYGMAYNAANVLVEERRDHLSRGDRFSLDSAYRLTHFRHNAPLSGNALGPLGTPAVEAARTSTWALDGAHNWRTYIQRNVNRNPVLDTTGGVNEYSSFSGAAQTFDNNGNLKTDTTRAYTYDFGNRLVEVKSAGGASLGRYVYDAEGRRVLKITPSTMTRYLYRGWEEIEERNASNTVIQQYVQRWGLDRPVQFKKLSGTGTGTYYYHDDGRGNVGALTNSTQGVVYRAEYDAWGDGSLGGSTLISPTDPNTFLASDPVGSPFLWQARRLDAESGLYYYRYRYYQSKQGRFVQADPIGSWADRSNVGNRYAFGGGRMFARDPMGLYDVDEQIRSYYPEVAKRIDTIGDRVQGNAKLPEVFQRELGVKPGELAEVLKPGQGPLVYSAQAPGNVAERTSKGIALDPDFLKRLNDNLQPKLNCTVEKTSCRCTGSTPPSDSEIKQVEDDLDVVLPHETAHGYLPPAGNLVDAYNEEITVDNIIREIFGRQDPVLLPRTDTLGW